MYQGEFSGLDVVNITTVGENIPESPFDNIGYNLCGCNFNSYLPTRKNFIYIGGYRANSSFQSGPAFTALETYVIDNKYDDGEPDQGFILADRGTLATGNCITGGSLTQGDEYLISDTTTDCVFGVSLD